MDRRVASQPDYRDRGRVPRVLSHPSDAFALPRRLRASHLFLAAPAETPSEDVESKRLLIESLSQRIEQGENFSDLVAEASEDEATKGRGGDLGFFASSRMLPEFFAAATNLPVGGLSKPIRSPLGFHIIQLTAIEPARLISFEEARAEIMNALQNEQRRLLADGLTARLTKEAEISAWRVSSPLRVRRFEFSLPLWKHWDESLD